jgi:hypothetical protein
MDGHALTLSEMRIEMQSQQSELLALGQELIRDYGRINRAEDEAGIERKAKNLALVTKAVQGVHELISRFGETEMDDGDTTTPLLSPEERKARYETRRAEVRAKLIDIATRMRADLAEQAGSVDGPASDIG